MNIIVDNYRVKEFFFRTFPEQRTFLNNLDNSQILELEDTFGDYYYCYIFCNSITGEKKIVLSFSCDLTPDEISVCFWSGKKIVLLYLGQCFYLIDYNDNLIIKSIDATSPIIGFYQINNDNMLILEETYIRTINTNGDILKKMTTDLIVDYYIKNNNLYAYSEYREYVYQL